jgi:hypothetical protein
MELTAPVLAKEMAKNTEKQEKAKQNALAKFLETSRYERMPQFFSPQFQSTTGAR